MDSNVEKILNDFGQRVTKLAKLNIKATRRVKNHKGKYVNKVINASGDLYKSVKYNVKVNPNSFSFDIEMLDYGVEVDEGRKAGGMEPLASSLARWIEKKPVRLRDINGQFVKMDALKIKSFISHLQYKIAKYGTSATNFLTEPFSEEFKKLPDSIIEAFSLGIDGFLEHALNEIK